MDMADRVEATTRRASSSVPDRMEPTVRDHSAEMVGRKATVVLVDGVDLLEVEDEAEQAPRSAMDLSVRLGRKISRSLPLAHTGGCAVRWGRMSYLPPPNRMSGSLAEKAEDECGAGSKQTWPIAC